MVVQGDDPRATPSLRRDKTQLAHQQCRGQSGIGSFLHPTWLPRGLAVFHQLILPSQTTHIPRARQALARLAGSGMLAPHPKTDNLFLVAAEHPMHFPHKKQAQMRERGKTSIGNEDVPFAQLGVHRGRVTHVMGAHRRGQHPQQQAGSRVKHACADGWPK